MKEKFRKVLRALRIDVLLYALYAKLALAVIKKLTAVKHAVRRFLTRLFPRNGKTACNVDTVVDTAVDTVTNTTENTVVDVTVDTVVDVTVITDNA